MSTRYITKKLQNKRILITGGRGFLGRHLVSELRQICSDVHLYQKDVRNIDTFTKRYDIVCHLAALNKVGSNIGVDLLFDVNVNGTLAVMEYCRKREARCILAASSAVYKPAMDNRLLREASRLGPVTLYGISKMLAENICKHHAENFGVSVIALRVFNMYGCGQKGSFLIPYAMHQLSKDKPVKLKMPRVVRDFVFITDVTQAFILSCAYDHNGFIALNVGTGHGLSVYELVKRIALRMGRKLQINEDGVKDSKADYIVADVCNISRILNWSARISMSDGLAMVAQK